MSNLFSKFFSPKNYLERGERIIKLHKGKYETYQKYVSVNPDIAEQYLAFIGKHPDAVYIKWDKAKERFTS